MSEPRAGPIHLHDVTRSRARSVLEAIRAVVEHPAGLRCAALGHSFTSREIRIRESVSVDGGRPTPPEVFSYPLRMCAWCWFPDFDDARQLLAALDATQDVTSDFEELVKAS